MSDAPTNGNGNGGGGIKVTPEMLFRIAGIAVTLIGICFTVFQFVALGAIVLAGAYYAAMTLPVKNDVQRHSDENKDRDKVISELAIGMATLEKKQAEMETQISGVKQLEFIRIAYEHKFVQILWKEQKGYELSDIPPFMPGAETWTR